MLDTTRNPIAPPADSALSRPDFVWGVATASFQIEGATTADGRLPSIWDTFCATPGKVLGGDTGEPACDHYRRWEQDVDLIAGLGVDSYRLSMAWPRVMQADGTPNERGLDFYKRLLDRLAERGLQRMVTLYHWDLPQHLEDAGGWLNRDTALRFADYADLVSRRLAGRVSAWATLNEPWCSAYLGYSSGHHAPGKADPTLGPTAMHHLLLGHGLALAPLKANDAQAKRGIVANIGRGATPGEGPGGGTTGSAEDLEAVRLFEMQHNHWVLQPLLEGSYPQELFTRLWPGSAPPVQDGDMALIAQPLDFLGINYYFRSTVQADGRGGYTEVQRPGVERTQMGWEVHPQGLEELLVGFKARYPNLPPIHITENGMASDDRVEGGRVADEQRIAYLRRHFEAVDRAVRAGVDVRGYYVWSLMDNFEWAFGYERRFGLVHVDYRTQERTLKDSARCFHAFLQQRKVG
jgi:beta-glucosidase